MAKIRARPESGKLYFDFFYGGKRCREQTELLDTVSNRKRVEVVLRRIEAEIENGTFDYLRYFPNSKTAAKVASSAQSLSSSIQAGLPNQSVVLDLDAGAPTFTSYVDTWLTENEVRWRRTTRESRRDIIQLHLRPRFGDSPISGITRAHLLDFRAALAKRPGKKSNSSISPKTMNEIMGVLLGILAEGSDRYAFPNPGQRIKRLKVPRKDIEPFSLNEALLIIASARPDYRHYFTIRFFTGMRTGEVHGLKWRHVDFERRQILVRESFTHGEQDGIKTDGSMREITMSQQVFDALKAQETMTRRLGEYVFCSRNGLPIDLHNFVNRVWNPLLSNLALARRRPYQMRHTAATLWLAAGENPEWIASQLGHTTSEMLFRIYSRFVPNLTRKDGSAFERMLSANAPTSPESAT